MCGIFAYHGQDSAVDQVVTGLKRLEYRGYDSWGVAVATNQELSVFKQVGKVTQVADEAELGLPKGQIAIGHTRWATHGGVTQANAHPHLASDSSFALAQNGVVENFDTLKAAQLQAGENFKSETDTEVIVKLIEAERQAGKDLLTAVRAAHQKLSGRNTIILITPDGEIIAARQGSPLVIGFGNSEGEVFVSSDVLSFATQVKEVVTVDNGQVVQVSPAGEVQLFDLKSGAKLEIKREPLQLDQPKIDKEGYEHFMLKEIHETPVVIRQVSTQPVERLTQAAELIKQAHSVYTIGSGTAGMAAAQIAYYLRSVAKVPAVSLVGADANEYLELFTPEDVLIAPSQSGETADVLEILEQAKELGVKIISYVNMPASSMTKLADLSFLAGAGPEICVMSTKVFTSQIAWGYLLAKAVAGQTADGQAALAAVADSVQAYLEDSTAMTQLSNLAQQLSGAKDIFLMAKGQLFQVMREGMVKLIEGSYKHAHAIPAGDLKHYAITLMEAGVPVLVAVADDAVRSDVLNAAHEVKTRGATVIGLSAQAEASFDSTIVMPVSGETAAIALVVPVQLLAYHLAVVLGNDVDHPRNIAKSVTVK